MTKTEQILKQVKRAVNEANKKGIQLSKRQQQIYKNIFESAEQRGKYATAKYLLSHMPTSKTETAQRNLQETVTRLKRKGQTLTSQQQQKYEKIISSTEQRGKATAIKFLESEIKQPKTPTTYTVRAKTEPPKQEKRIVLRETKKKQSKTTAIGNLKRKRTQMTKAGFEINQAEKINDILLNPDNYTVAEIQQVTKTLTGTAGGREFTPEETTDYLNIYQRMNKKGKEKSGINSSFNKKRLKEDKSLSNKAFIEEMRIKSSNKYKDMREKQFLYNILTAIEGQQGQLQQDLYQRVIEIYERQGQEGVVKYFENMRKTNESLFATLFAYADDIVLNIRERMVRDELDLPKGKTSNLTMDKVARIINTADQQESRKQFLQQAEKAGLNPNLI